MRALKLKIRESDDTWHEFLIEEPPGGGPPDIRPIDNPRCDADRSIAVAIGNEHCPVCLKQPEEDCETVGQTIVISVEFADA